MARVLFCNLHRILQLLSVLPLGAFVLLVVGCAHRTASVPVVTTAPKSDVMVDGRIALASLMALSDGHLRKILDSLAWLATTPEARSGEWRKIQKPLAEVASKNIEATYWFALPNGTYWTLEVGQAPGNLTDREYWPRLMAKQSVVGDLVVSKSTGKNVAIVAVPILHANGRITGVIGTSVHLDKLTERLKQEMQIASPLIFYAVDAKPLGALNSDVSLIFTEPKKFSGEMSQVFDEMLSHQEGMIQYQFRGRTRRVLYRKSPFVGWWYALGVAESL